MVELLMTLAIAFSITFYAIPVIIYVAKEKKLFDEPDTRKLHSHSIPCLGGIGIFAGFLSALLLIVNFEDDVRHFQYLVAAAMVIFFVGVKDDLLNIPPFKKFLGQIFAAWILIFKGGFVIHNLGGILGLNELPEFGAYALTFFTIVVIINAYNLIDGVDGLAASLTLVSNCIFAIYFAINGQIAFACIATALIGALTAFLIFNFNPARIFMGDTGSLLLGLINSVLVIQFINTAQHAPVLPIQAAPVMGFAILFVPLFDTLRVFAMRILHGDSPFTPDRNHLHHILLRLGLNHKGVALSLTGVSIAIPTLAYFMQAWNINLILAVLVSISFLSIYILVNIYGRRKIKQFIDKAATGGFTQRKIGVSSYINQQPTHQN